MWVSAEKMVLKQLALSVNTNFVSALPVGKCNFPDVEWAASSEPAGGLIWAQQHTGPLF